MEDFIRLLASNKLYIIGVAIIASVIIYALLKKLIKILLIVIIAAAIYLAVVYHSSGKFPDSIERIKNEKMNNSELKKLNDIINNLIRNSLEGNQSRVSSSEKI